MAGEQRVEIPRGGGRRRTPLLTRLNSTHRLLEAAHARLTAAAHEGAEIGPAGDWLLDNFHVVLEHIGTVRESLPRGYYRELPKLAGGRLVGFPRVYQLAITLISHTEGRIDRENVSGFVTAWQQVTPLTLGELWAIPAMLRLGLIENTRRMTLRTVQWLDQRVAADTAAARLSRAAATGAATLEAALGHFAAHPPNPTPAFVARLLHQLRFEGGPLPAVQRLEQWIVAQNWSAEEATSRSTQRLALTQVGMANGITSLRAIARIDWRAVVEAMSRVEAVLREDPSGFYPRMTFATRDRYRHVVERIARRSGLTEEAVARRAIASAGTAAGHDDARQDHVGYHLIDDGRAALERDAGYRPAWGETLHDWVRRHPNVVFGGGLALVTLAALAGLFGLGGEAARSAWPAVLLLGIVPSIGIAVAVMNQLVTTSLPPRTLPALDLQISGVPAEFRTAVVIPTMLDSLDAVSEALENLEVQFLANREAHLHFALLSDFTDAATPTTGRDAEILATAIAGVTQLNARYAPKTEDSFYLLHRARRWNAQEGVWMGWERKRGKLAEFNHFILEGAADGFEAVVGNVTPLRSVQYVITLDADTHLPPDAAPRLIGTLAHPLNRAGYDPVRGRVVHGYGILQPRVGVSSPSAHRSVFATIYSGHPGVDPYTTAVSDVYQDLYGEGSYTGKGIYDVEAFERATRGRFPENAILSHDLIEGSYARAGLATEVIVYDDYPCHYQTFAHRKHRWIRGDWQLLPWLARRTPSPDGPEPNRLSLLSRWKIADNLRRSTEELAQLALLLAGWTVLPGSPLRWTLLALGAVAAPWVTALLLAAVRPPLDRSWRAYYGAVGRDALISAKQLVLAVVFLPHQAWISVDAIARTLWRLTVSRRHLLEWRTASQLERSRPTGATTLWRTMAPAVVLGLVLGLALAWHVLSAGPGSGSALWPLVGAVLPIAVSWMASPLVAHRLSAPPARQDRRLSDAERRQAMRYAALHWQYFEQFVSADTQWLAPDNFQDHPEPVVAMRTSPTNIGLHLLATVSAHDLGFLTLEELVVRLERAFGTLARMRRFRGHFYNWYDLRDLRVLDPPYISTVDSGNLAGHLIALRQACLSLGQATADPVVATRLTALADQAQGFVMGMDFQLLFNEGRKLFTIGYQPETQEADPSYYDLLASEARLASFVAVAKDDVPVEHWFRLGRTLTAAAGGPALVSWSGSMFEYLMPMLVMRTFPTTLLAASCAAAVRSQVAWGARRGLPWGTSESAFNFRDRHGTYQYRAFGVPDLALKRGLDRDQVVAPYASVLATMVEPQQALENLALLEQKGALGPYGFRDALDYTRPAPDARFALVSVYMAHHLGMGLVALANALTDGVWPARFHADPLVRSAEVLLHERIPRRVMVQSPQVTQPRGRVAVHAPDRPAVRQFDSADLPRPHVALLGQPPYTVMVTHGGGGYSRFETLAVTRWQGDSSRDAQGQFCYIKDLALGRVWSAAHQPVGAQADWYHAYLASDRVTFHRADGRIETHTVIVVVPEDAAEVRRTTLTNLSEESCEVEVTSYGEVVMAPPESDRAHPAFSNLFVETEWHAWCSAITATRRPRTPEETPLWCVHVVDAGPARVGNATCETDRARFLGRGRSARDPAAMRTEGPLSGTTGAVLDPIFALRIRLRLAPRQSVAVAFTTLVATSRAQAFERADRYHDRHAAQRALDLAGTTSRVELAELELTPTDAAVFQELAGHLLYGTPALRATEAERRRNLGAQPLLWGTGVSGDWPIVLATIASAEGVPTLREVLAAHRYWRRRGLRVDLVILNAHAATYHQELGDRILSVVYAYCDSGSMDRPGGVYIRRADLLSDDERLMLAATARVQIPCAGGSLASLVAAAIPPAESASYQDERRPVTPRAPERSGSRMASAVRRLGATLPALLAPLLGRPANGPPRIDPNRHPDQGPGPLVNGLGRVTPYDDYQIVVAGDHLPPAPWANVVANPHGGFVVTERGGGFVWAGNSYLYRLTPWHNDPVSDPVSEVLYLQDQDSGALWCVTPGPIRRDEPTTIHHGAGWSSFAREQGGIATHLTVGMADGAAVKLSLLQVTNRGKEARQLRLTAYVEWTLGVHREQTRFQVRTDFDRSRGAILAQNTFDPEYAEWRAFHALSEPITGHTGSRREFLGPNGDPADPAALRGDRTLTGTTRVGIDPCSALQCHLALAPGETREVAILLGACEGEAAAWHLVDTHRGVLDARAALERSVEDWARRLAVVTVRTPEPTFDTMVNRWALYQTISCRLWARSAVYQSGGAYGFRDQLQDVMACVHAEPGLARAQIVRAAGRQFLEGDVQHWWHPQSGRGTRTRFSDDLVWLPYVASHYVRTTGDPTVLDEVVPFLHAPELEPGLEERYDQPPVSAITGTVYQHCVRALRRACTAGVHGLPLIGGGDWNDGMNRVGIQGRGESVWLAWFLITTLREFATLADAKGDGAVAGECRRQADGYTVAVEAHGWDGAWYRRAYYDDGTPLGSTRNTECRIDSIAQSWSVLSGAGARRRQAQAMAASETHLVQEDAGLMLLLTPPFDRTSNDPGYIKGYLPGVRENGAQYTHAALWAVLATALQGKHDRAFALFQMLNPLTRTRTPAEVARYRVEPYAVAADVYAAGGQRGRGGWTWYTGSASWLYRVGVEGILGLERRGAMLLLEPRVPAAWPGYTIEYQFGSSRYHITVTLPVGATRGPVEWTLDTHRLPGPGLPLVDDGVDHVVTAQATVRSAPAGTADPVTSPKDG